MKFIDGYRHFPRDRDLIRVVNAAATRVFEGLKASGAISLDISEPSRHLIAGPLETIEAYLRRCARLLAWALPLNETPYSDLTLFDHGSPLGVVSSLAKECSVGTVIYNGIDVSSCHDAQAIAGAMGAEADFYVRGDIDIARRFLESQALDCDVFVSCDGIQYVESPRRFFEELFDLSDTAFSFALSARTTFPEPLRRASGTTRSPDSGRDHPISPPRKIAAAHCTLPDGRMLRDQMIDVGFEVDLLARYRVDEGSVISGVLKSLPGFRTLLGMIVPGRHTRRTSPHTVSPFVLRGKKPQPRRAATTRSRVRPARDRAVARPAMGLGTS